MPNEDCRFCGSYCVDDEDCLRNRLELAQKELKAANLQNEVLQKDLAAALEILKARDIRADSANRLNREYLDHIEWAWGILANAGPEGCMGNWSKLDPEWVKIAENWRDKYHKILDERRESLRPVCEHKEFRTRFGINGYRECKSCGTRF